MVKNIKAWVTRRTAGVAYIFTQFLSGCESFGKYQHSVLERALAVISVVVSGMTLLTPSYTSASDIISGRDV